MKNFILLLTLIFMSVSYQSFAFETNDVDCDAYAESTERISKDVKSSLEEESDDSAVKSL